MADVKLHRCNYTFLHTEMDPCWRVQRALDEQGISYEVVKEGWGKGKRPRVESLSGQSKLPVLELANGDVYRAESKDMAARVRARDLPGL
jgi:glutathione S-transferase